jgi:hypothetical protein
MMSLAEVDSAIARNVMKWRRLTRAAVQSDVGVSPPPEHFGHSLDPHWYDRDGRIVAIAEGTESREGTNVIWSPTKNTVDAQMVRFKLSEVFQSVVLARLAVGAMIVFALFVNNPIGGTASKSHIAMGATEEIATSLCALATVGIDVELLEDPD